MDKISTKFSGLAQKLRAQAGQGGIQVSESPRQATKPGVGVSCPGTLMSPYKATGKLFVIPLCQRAPGRLKLRNNGPK